MHETEKLKTVTCGHDVDGEIYSVFVKSKSCVVNLCEQCYLDHEVKDENSLNNETCYTVDDYEG